jgi:molecular chaperone GrpE (heat shock protein)
VSDFYGKMKRDREAGLRPERPLDKAIRHLREAVSAQGGVNPKYKVLQVDMLKESDREKAAAVSSFVTTGDEAYKLAGQDGFGYKDLDEHRRRVGVVTYHGVEVSLLFRKLVVEREPGPADPIPERTLTAPADEWLSISLLNTDKATVQKGTSDQLRAMITQRDRFETLYRSEAQEKKNLEGELNKYRESQQELRALRERVGLQAKEIQASTMEIERLKTDVQRQVLGRREDKANMVRQLMPVFNTAVLAGLHRVGDQLYGMLKKQIIEGLNNIGIEMVDPAVGEAFDPQLHHAVHSYEFPTGAQEVNTVRQVNQIGWKLTKGQVLEPAMVAVGVEVKEDEHGKDAIDVGLTGKVQGA